LEEIAYEAGRHALAEQEAFVAGIRGRAGTLLAAHALVASFLGAAVLRERGLTAAGWIALATLIAGLAVAVRLLGGWRLRFSVDPRVLHEELRDLVALEPADGTLDWLLNAADIYGGLRERNIEAVGRMTYLLELLGTLTIAQAVAWIVGLLG
jgi:hypothetical protein